MGLLSKLRILVFDVGEYLIQVAGMKRVDVVLRLSRVGIVFGIDNQHLAASGEHDITLHHRQHGAKAIIQGPRDLRGRRRHLRALLGVVFENELLV